MRLSGLVILLLWAFSVPVLVKYRLLPVEGEPYLLHAVIFGLLGIVSIIEFTPKIFSKSWPRENFGHLAFFLIIGAVFFGALFTLIVDRGRVAPGSAYGVHDIVIQLEAALQFLSQDKNPYKEIYIDTPLREWAYTELGKGAVNPALYHFVMPPWYLLFAFPFYAGWSRSFGYFDGRLPLLFTFVAIILVLWHWFRDKNYAKVAILVSLLSPLVAGYNLEGRSDGFALFWLLASLWLLEDKRVIRSAIFLGFAITSKQTIWFAVPFWAIYLFVKNGGWRILIQASLVVFGMVTILVGPFLAWDSGAFLDSVIFYLSGNTAAAYPISGYGWGMLLYSWGLIRDLHGYFPFIWWQAGLGVPVFIITSVYLKRRTTMSNLLFSYGVGLLIVWYFSRYFNNSHIAFVGTIFSLALIKSWDEQRQSHEKV